MFPDPQNNFLWLSLDVLNRILEFDLIVPKNFNFVFLFDPNYPVLLKNTRLTHLVADTHSSVSNIAATREAFVQCCVIFFESS